MSCEYFAYKKAYATVWTLDLFASFLLSSANILVELASMVHSCECMLDYWLLT